MSADSSTLLFRALPERFKLSPDEKRALKEFARTLADRIVAGRPFTCLLTTDRELHRLNKAFLNHDYPTDVLSFPATNQNGDLGEIAVSVQRAETQAREFGHSRSDEIRVLMLHGLLHLTGMDHQRDGGEMARAESKWRAELGLPLTLLARAASSKAAR